MHQRKSRSILFGFPVVHQLNSLPEKLMSTHLQFELVSPEALIFSKPVALVTVPGGEGDFGVLPGHAPMITTVRPGVIDIYEQDSDVISERLFVSGGFAEVVGERCTVLAEEAIPVAELHRPQIEETLSQLVEDAELAKLDSERIEIEAKLVITRAKLQAVS
jgi:F-type H+-transporting ATPase subunit epsilon